MKQKIKVFQPSQLSEKELAELEEIFFLTSSIKEFAHEEQKQQFFYRWAGIYLEHFPEDVFLVKQNNQIRAYLLACLNTQKSLEILTNYNRSLSLFEHQYDRFPAHLHINCHPNFQGQGYGGELLDALFKKLQEEKVKGVHIITSPEQKNVHFYRKYGFDFEEVGLWKDQKLLFMGKSQF